MSKKIKILFVQDKFGKLSEAFLYRINCGLSTVNVEVLTGEYINQQAFPFDISKITLWGKASLSFYHEVIIGVNIYPSSGY